MQTIILAACCVFLAFFCGFFALTAAARFMFGERWGWLAVAVISTAGVFCWLVVLGTL